MAKRPITDIKFNVRESITKSISRGKVVINNDVATLLLTVPKIDKGEPAPKPIFAVVVKDIRRDNPDRLFPENCTWGTPDDPWALTDQDTYIVINQSNTAEVYSAAATYEEDDFVLFTILATTDPMTEPKAEIGFGYKLLYKANTDIGTPESFQHSKWDLVTTFAEGQWEIEKAIGFDETSAKRPSEDMRDMMPWFEVGSTVPIIKYILDEVDYQLFAQTFIYIDESDSSSISWNGDESRAMAVFR